MSIKGLLDREEFTLISTIMKISLNFLFEIRFELSVMEKQKNDKSLALAQQREENNSPNET
jgi:hypothetical protein